jgi:hypothetical protein
MQDRQVLVGPMTAAELREAIVGPAAQAGLVLEPGLVETMLADLGEGARVAAASLPRPLRYLAGPPGADADHGRVP